MDDAGTVTCWGHDSYGETAAPDGLDTIIQVSVGANHTCALDDEGIVTCWGDDSRHQVSGFWQ